MKIICCLLCVGLWLSASAEADSYSYRVDCLGGPGETGVYKIVPSAEQLFNLGGVPEKIRICDRRGKTVPYMRQPVWMDLSEPALSPVETGIDQVRKMPGGGLEIHFHLKGENLPLHEIEIQTPVRDFEQNIDLWGRMNEGEDWIRLLDNAFIFDSSRNLKAKNTVLRLPADCRCSLFRLVVSQAALERRRAMYDIRRIRDREGQEKFEEQAAFASQPFKIERILFKTRTFQRVVRQPSILFFAVRNPQISWNEKERRTVCLLRPDFYPVAGIRFHCRDRNFSRLVSASVQNGPGSRGRIFSVDIPGYEKSELDLMLSDPGVYPSQIAVTISHGDNPPLEDLSLEWLVREEEYVFVAEKDFFPLTVTSSSGGDAPRYEQDGVIREAMKQMLPVRLSLENGGGQSRSRAVPAGSLGEQRRFGWMLWIALAAAVGVLAFGIVAAGRKAVAVSEEQ